MFRNEARYMKKILFIIYLSAIAYCFSGCLTPDERKVVYPAAVKAAKWYYFGFTPSVK